MLKRFHSTCVGIATGLTCVIVSAFAPSATLEGECVCEYDRGQLEKLGDGPGACADFETGVIAGTETETDGVCAHSGCPGPHQKCYGYAMIWLRTGDDCHITAWRDFDLVAEADHVLGVAMEDSLACEEFVDWYFEIQGVRVVRCTNICVDCPGM